MTGQNRFKTLAREWEANLVHPVRVEHAKVAATAANALLSNVAEVALELALVDAVVLGLAVHNALGVGALAATAAHAHAVHDVSLLGLVSEAAGLVRARGAGGAVHSGELAVLPAANAEQEAHHVGLLLLVELLHILVST